MVKTPRVTAPRLSHAGALIDVTMPVDAARKSAAAPISGDDRFMNAQGSVLQAQMACLMPYHLLDASALQPRQLILQLRPQPVERHAHRDATPRRTPATKRHRW